MDWTIQNSGDTKNISTHEGYIKLQFSDRVEGDHGEVLPIIIPGKGKAMAKQSLAMTNAISSVCSIASVMCNWLNSDEDVQILLTMLPANFIVTQYLEGTLYEEYRAAENSSSGLYVKIQDAKLPRGLKEGAKLDKPIFRPKEGNTYITLDRLSEIFDHHGVKDGRRVAEEARDKCIRMYEVAAKFTQERGYFLISTMFKLGYDKQGTLRVADEVCNMDTSRYTKVGEWEPGTPIMSVDPLKNYIKAKKAKDVNVTEIPDDIKAATVAAYNKLTTALTSLP